MTYRLGVALIFPLAACARAPKRAVAAIGPATELICGDSTARRALYRAAASPARALPPAIAETDVGTLVVRIAPRDSVRPDAPAQVQLWGHGSGAGNAADTAGVVTLSDRPPGLSQLGVRGGPAQPRPWLYAVTVRAGYADTVSIDLTKRCTRIVAPSAK